MRFKINKNLDDFVINFLEQEAGYWVDDEDDDEWDQRRAVIQGTLEWMRLQADMN